MSAELNSSYPYDVNRRIFLDPHYVTRLNALATGAETALDISILRKTLTEALGPKYNPACNYMRGVFLDEGHVWENIDEKGRKLTITEKEKPLNLSDQYSKWLVDSIGRAANHEELQAVLARHQATLTFLSNNVPGLEEEAFELEIALEGLNFEGIIAQRLASLKVERKAQKKSRAKANESGEKVQNPRFLHLYKNLARPQSHVILSFGISSNGNCTVRVEEVQDYGGLETGITYIISDGPLLKNDWSDLPPALSELLLSGKVNPGKMMNAARREAGLPAMTPERVATLKARKNAA